MQTKFQNLTKEQKADFFVKCQELLVQFHPDSPFIFRQDNVEPRKAFVQNFLKNYKGYVYRDDNVCILYNYIKVAPTDVIQTIKDNLYQEPHPDYNGISIDFVVFRDLKDCLEFCQMRKEPRVEYVVFVKNNEPKVYFAEKLLAHLK